MNLTKSPFEQANFDAACYKLAAHCQHCGPCGRTMVMYDKGIRKAEPGFPGLCDTGRKMMYVVNSGTANA